MFHKCDRIFLPINHLRNISKTNWNLVTKAAELQQKLAYIDTEKVKQLHTGIQNLKYQLVSSQSTKKVLTLQKKQVTTDQLQN